MRLRVPLLAIAAATATFVLVAAGVSEALLPQIEFSVLVGIPAGIAAGLVVGAVVFFGLSDRDEYSRRHRLAAALGAFGAVALLVLFGSRLALGLPNSQALVAGAVGGVFAAIASYAKIGRPAIQRG